MTNAKKPNRWKAGQSGNPAGRPQGRPDRRSAWRGELADALPAILARLVEAAKDGDIQAAGLILSRIAPPLRPSREPIAVEGIPNGATATEIAQALVAAATRGDVPSDAAAELVAALGAVAKLREVDELAARITSLEDRNTP